MLLMRPLAEQESLPDLLEECDLARRQAAPAARWSRSQMPCGDSKSFQSSFSLLTGAKRVLLLIFVEGNNIVRPNPARRSDRKTLLGAFGEFTRGLVVAAREGGLGRGKVRVGEIIFVRIGHCQRRVGVGCFRFLDDGCVQK